MSMFLFLPIPAMEVIGLVGLVSAIFLGLVAVWYVRSSPKPLPIVGNLFDMPSEYPWLVYDQWFKTYGDIIHINVLGQPIIILGSLKRTSDIFDKRSSSYSDRVRMPMINELMGWDFSFGFMRYGSRWKQHRRMFNSNFNPAASAEYKPAHIKEARALLGRLLVDGQGFMHHLRHTFVATIMRAVYDIDVAESDDLYISTAEAALAGLAIAGNPGAFLVDLIPFLKYVPTWVPGAGFQKLAAHWKRLTSQLVEIPFQVVKGRMNEGTARPCATVRMLENLPEDNYSEYEVVAKNCAAAAYGGGADTIVSSAQTFFFAMAKYPEVQKRAQAELDAIVGCDRLPDFDDRPSLPYVNAIVKETMRWQNVTPLGISHTCTQDDTYDGYFIPKGSIIIGNTWSIMHDPKAYPEPDEFKPERFIKDGVLDPTVRDPNVAAFGFGRRICPGRYFSDNSLYSIVCSVLSVYDITPASDEKGELKLEMTSGLISYPRPFDVSITPRSDAARSFIIEPPNSSGN
ncbi:cytochrome P450 [Crucibulum laeve]|uniref:Cytochrome P450 n=1 Tax=Crucibulum laeve TaxID=68775 RepID=A0A5C3LRS5_9AGAR|nr:cytochrome P450 [Crucibulum laeve]